MEEISKEFHADEEFSLKDIFCAIWSKILILLLVLVLGAAAGGLYGYLDNKDVYTYGAAPEFYVNPDKTPKEGESSDKESQYGVYGAYGQHVMENMVKLLSSESFSEKLMFSPSLEKLRPDESKNNADGSLNTTYASFLRNINDSVRFSYTGTTSSGVSDLSKSFIYVSISVTGKENRALAEALLIAVETEVPAYIEKYMVVPSGYDFTNCVKTSVLDEIHQTNKGHAKDAAIKYGLLLGAAAFLVASVVAVIVSRTDNRLRDYEMTSKHFGVPVLGVLPSIDKRQKNGEEQK